MNGGAAFTDNTDTALVDYLSFASFREDYYFDVVRWPLAIR